MMRPPPWSAASFAVNITTLVHLGCAGANRMEPLSVDSIDGGAQLDAIAPRERSAVISIRTRLHVIVSGSYASTYGRYCLAGLEAPTSLSGGGLAATCALRTALVLASPQVARAG
jgi:hypothetical protein